MKKNKLSISSAYSFLAVLALGLAGKASAQWSVPANIFNLGDDLDEMILNLTNWLVGFVVLISVVAIIWGGLNYISSSGDTQRAERSKMIIYYAFIGMFIAGIAYAIIKVIVTVILK